MENLSKVTNLLTDLFDSIGLKNPSNFNAIAEYISKDLEVLKDDIDLECIAYSFNRWVESKS
jgi:hypothetical protein